MIRSGFLTVALFVICSIVNAQTLTPTFEGEIIYKNTFKSKIATMRDGQFASILGNVHNYFIREGNYKLISNGLFAQWQLYNSAENRIYNKMASSDTIFWNDAAQHDDELLGTKLNKNAETILGYACDELILTCRSGVQKYYFNSALRIDSRVFINHKYGNYYNYLSIANAVPLKMVIEEADFVIESVATEVKPKKLERNFFELPPNSKTAKSSY